LISERLGPTWKEIGLFIIIAAAVTILLTITDQVIFDYYVLPIMEECHPQNNSKLCQDFRKKMDLEENSQLEIGSKYWAVLNANFWVLGAVMFVVRVFTARIFRGVIKGRKWHEIYPIMGGVWFAGTVIPFLFGMLDSGYYVLRGQMVPDKLAWLDNIGLFTIAQQWTGNPSTVEFWDVIFLNIIGMVIFVLIWVIAFYVNKRLAKFGKHAILE